MHPRSQSESVFESRFIDGASSPGALPRPISVRELAHHAAPQGLSRTSGAASFISDDGVARQRRASYGGASTSLVAPYSSSVYNSTSALNTSAGPDGSQWAAYASLSGKSLDTMSFAELYNHASRLQHEGKSVHSHLRQAYQKRDEYREEVGRLKQELHTQYMNAETQNRHSEKYTSIINGLHQSVATLRAELDAQQCRDRQARRLGEDGTHEHESSASNLVSVLQADLQAKESLIRELQERCRSAELHNQQDGGSMSPRGSAAHPTDTAGSSDSAYVDALCAQLDQLRQQHDALQAEHNASLELFNAERATWAEEREQLAAELDLLKENAASLTNQMAALAGITPEELAAMVQDRESLEKQLEEAHAAYHDLRSKEQPLEAAVLEAQPLREKLLAACAEKDAALHQLRLSEQQLKQLEEVVRNFSDEVGLSEEANSLRRTQVESLMNDLQETTRQASQTAEDLATAQAALRHAQEENERLREQNSTAVNAPIVNSSEASEGAPQPPLVEALKIELELTQEQKRTLQAELDALQRDLTQMQEKCALLEVQASASVQPLANVEDDYSAEVEISNLRAALDSLAAQLADEQDRRAELETKLAEKMLALDDLQKHNTELENQRNTSTTVHEESASPTASTPSASPSLEQSPLVEALRTELELTQAQKRTLQEELEHCHRELDELRLTLQQRQMNHPAIVNPTESDSSHDAAMAEISNLREAVDALAARLAAEEDRNAELETKLAEQIIERNELQTQVTALKGQSATSDDAHIHTQQLATHPVGTSEASSLVQPQLMEALKTELDLTQAQNRALKDELAHYRGEVAKLQQDATTTHDRSNVANSAAEISNLQEALNSMAARLTEAQECVQELQQEKDNLQHLQNAERTSGATTAPSTEDADALKSDNERLRAALAAAEEAVRQLAAQHTAQSEELAALRLQLCGDAEGARVRMSASATSAGGDTVNMQAAIDRLAADLAAEQDRNAELRSYTDIVGRRVEVLNRQACNQLRQWIRDGVAAEVGICATFLAEDWILSSGVEIVCFANHLYDVLVAIVRGLLQGESLPRSRLASVEQSLSDAMKRLGTERESKEKLLNLAKELQLKGTSETATHNEELTSLRQQLQTATAAATGSNAEIANLRAAVEALAGRLAAEESRSAQLQSEKEAKDHALADLGRSTTELHSSVAATVPSSVADALKSDNDRLRAALAAAEEAVRQLAAQHTAQSEELGALRTELAQSASSCEALESSSSITRSECMNLRAALAEMADRLAETEDINKLLNLKLGEVLPQQESVPRSDLRKQNAAGASETVQAMKDDVMNLRAALSAAEEAVRQLAARHTAQSEELAALRLQLGDAEGARVRMSASATSAGGDTVNMQAAIDRLAADLAAEQDRNAELRSYTDIVGRRVEVLNRQACNQLRQWIRDGVAAEVGICATFLAEDWILSSGVEIVCFANHLYDVLVAIVRGLLQGESLPRSRLASVEQSLSDAMKRLGTERESKEKLLNLAKELQLKGTSETATHNEELTSLRQQLQTATAAATGSNAEIANLRAAVEALAGRLAAEEARSAQLQSEKEAKDHALAALGRSTTELHSSVAATVPSSVADALKSDNDRLRAALAAAEEAVRQLAAQHTAQSEELAALRLQLGDAEGARVRMSASATSAGGDTVNMQAAIDRLAADLAAEQDRNAELRSYTDIVGRRVEVLNRQACNQLRQWIRDGVAAEVGICATFLAEDWILSSGVEIVCFANHLYDVLVAIVRGLLQGESLPRSRLASVEQSLSDAMKRLGTERESKEKLLNLAKELQLKGTSETATHNEELTALRQHLQTATAAATGSNAEIANLRAAVEALAGRLAAEEARSAQLQSEKEAKDHALAALGRSTTELHSSVAATVPSSVADALKSDNDRLRAALAAAEEAVRQLAAQHTAQSEELAALRLQLCGDAEGARVRMSASATSAGGDTVNMQAAIDRLAADLAAEQDRNAELRSYTDIVGRRVEVLNRQACNQLRQWIRDGVAAEVGICATFLAEDWILSSGVEIVCFANHLYDVLVAIVRGLLQGESLPRSRLASVEQSLSDAMKRLGTERESKEKLLNLAKELQLKGTSETATHNEELTSLRQQLQTATAAATGSNAEIANLRAAVEALAGRLAAEESRSAQLQSEKEAKDHALAALGRSTTELHSSVAATVPSSVADALKSDNDRLRAALAAAEEAVRQLAAQHTAQSEELAVAIASRATVESASSSASADVVNLKAALNRLATDVADVQASFDDARRFRDMIQEQMKQIKKSAQNSVRQWMRGGKALSVEELSGLLSRDYDVSSGSCTAEYMEDLFELLCELVGSTQGHWISAAEAAASAEKMLTGTRKQLEDALQMKSALELRQQSLIAEVEALNHLKDLSAASCSNSMTALDELAIQLTDSRDVGAALESMSGELRSEKERCTVAEAKIQELEKMLISMTERMACQEALIFRLNAEADMRLERIDQLHASLYTAEEGLETGTLAQTDLAERLASTQKALEQTVAIHNDNIVVEERLRDANARLRSRVDERRNQLQQCVAHLHDSIQCVGVATGMVAQDDASLAVNSRGATALEGVLHPLGKAVQWMEEILSQSLDEDLVDRDVNDDSRETSPRDSITSPFKTPRASSTHVRDSTVSPTASELTEMLQELSNHRRHSREHIQSLEQQLQDMEKKLLDTQAAMEALAVSTVEETERSESLYAAVTQLNERMARAQDDFDAQLLERTEATTAELYAARQAEARALEARRRAEDLLATAEQELRDERDATKKLEEDFRQLQQEAEQFRLSASTTTTFEKRATSTLDVDLSSRRHNAELIEQAQMLQISSLQADLLISRRHIRDLEAQQSTVNDAYVILEDQLAQLETRVGDADALRQSLRVLREEHKDLLYRYEQLVEITNMTDSVREIQDLRRQLRTAESALEEEKARVRDLRLAMSQPGLRASHRQEVFRESLSGLSTQLAVVQAQYARSGTTAANRRTPRASAFPGGDEDAAVVLQSRIQHLEANLREKENTMEKLFSEQLSARAAMESLQDRLGAKSSALEQSERLNMQYANTIEALSNKDTELRQTLRRTTARSPSRSTTSASFMHVDPSPAPRAPVDVSLETHTHASSGSQSPRTTEADVHSLASTATQSPSTASSKPANAARKRRRGPS